MLIHHFGSSIFALLPAMLLCACFNAVTDGMRSLAASLVRGLSQRPGPWLVLRWCFAGIVPQTGREQLGAFVTA